CLLGAWVGWVPGTGAAGWGMPATAPAPGASSSMLTTGAAQERARWIVTGPCGPTKSPSLSDHSRSLDQGISRLTRVVPKAGTSAAWEPISRVVGTRPRAPGSLEAATGAGAGDNSREGAVTLRPGVR